MGVADATPARPEGPVDVIIAPVDLRMRAAIELRRFTATRSCWSTARPHAACAATPRSTRPAAARPAGTA